VPRDVCREHAAKPAAKLAKARRIATRPADRKLIPQASPVNLTRQADFNFAP
jgi:hypothetical protein